jgi:hypothetical protein
MPDWLLVYQALGVAAVSAAGVLLLLGRPWRPFRRACPAAGWVLGVAVGFLLGCGVLGIWPRWPLEIDRDRWLGVLLPAVLAVELTAAFRGRAGRLVWALRLLVAAAAGRVLLHNTVYLTGPGPSQWTPAEAVQSLGGPAVVLALVWVLLVQLAPRAGRSLPLALAVSCAGTGVAVILSAYLTGGLMGLPLAAALCGVVVASFAVPDPQHTTAAVGVAVVGLFALLVLGHFMVEMSTAHALVLLAAPLLAWLPEVPGPRRLPSWLRGALRIALVAIPVAVVVQQAWQRYTATGGP